MINKFKVLLASLVLVSFGSFSAKAIGYEGFSVGLTALWGEYEADGSETVASAVESDTGAIEVQLGSVFIEADMGPIAIGLDYIPFEADSEKATNARIVNANGDDGNQGTTDNHASVTIKDHVTLYALIKLADTGIFAKVGGSQHTIETNEQLGTGGAYGDIDSYGWHYGVGYQHTSDDGMFIRLSANWHDYDEESIVNSNNTDIKVKADLDGYSADLSVGKTF